MFIFKFWRSVLMTCKSPLSHHYNSQYWNVGLESHAKICYKPFKILISLFLIINKVSLSYVIFHFKHYYIFYLKYLVFLKPVKYVCYYFNFGILMVPNVPWLVLGSRYQESWWWLLVRLFGGEFDLSLERWLPTRRGNGDPNKTIIPQFQEEF